MEGILLGLEDVKGLTNSFPNQHVHLFPCQGESVWEYRKYLQEGHMDVGDNGEYAPCNSDLTPLFAQTIPITVDRKHAGFIYTSLSSCGKCKGDTQGFAINSWDLVVWACQGLAILKRGVVSAQGKMIIIWIPEVTLDHFLNLMKALSHDEHPRSNSNMDLPPAAQTPELVCLPRMPARFILTWSSFEPFLTHVGGGSLFP